ncbi:MAG: oxidative damage protection protein [Gammaproteobacteria bacterium]|nr:oxidative damage protection protein [Gammaproteobacteria bacterium]
MSKIIFCHKLQKEASALDKPPFPGPLGEEIFSKISKEAWQMWLSHQTMLINEYRLNLIEAQSRKFLTQEMQKFFFEDGSETPPGYRAE